MHPRTAALALAASAAVVTLTATGAAAGSDSPTPYSVTATGVELPAGHVLAEHAHLNVLWTSPAGAGARNVHLEGPGTRYHDLVGATAVTWERLGLPADACVHWVQVAGFDEHFGEGGQAPVCRTAQPVAAPAPVPAPPAPAAPAPAPAAPAPAAPAPAAPATGAPTTPTAAQPAVAATPAASPRVTSSPLPSGTAEVLAAGDDDGAVASAFGLDWEVPARGGELGATGTSAVPVLALGLAAVVAGTVLVLSRRGTPDA